MSAERSIAEEVERELLEQLFASAPRAMVIGLLFAIIAALVLRHALPHTFLWAWVGAFALVNAGRAAVADRAMRLPAEERVDAKWRRRAVIGHAASGIAWSVIIVAAILNAPILERQAIFFLFAVVTTFQAVGRSNLPVAIDAYLAAALVPVVATVILTEDERSAVLVLFFAVFAFAVRGIGRNSHRMMAESTSRRREIARLLADLTARSEALDLANRGKAHFLAAASHDLRQPMQALVLLVESLQAKTHEADARRLVASIRSAVDTMATLLNAILDLSKFEAGTVHPQPRHFAIGTTLERLAETHAAAATGKGLRFRVRPSGHIVDTDPVLLYRILSNFVSNAVRYTDRGGILVGCRRGADGVRIEVWDTGRGIPEDQREHVFRDYYQIGNQQRDREQGLGLGLSIARRTAELLGHTVGLRSRVGRGTMFSLTVKAGDPALVPAALASAEPAPLAGCRILVVDDDAQVRSALATLLEGWGCRVHSAGSAQEALAIADELTDGPDIVLSDYRLPAGENGIDLVRTLAGRPPHPAAILMSGDIVPDVLKRVEQSGYTLLHKPLRPARLRALLGSFWRMRAGAPEPAEGVAAP